MTSTAYTRGLILADILIALALGVFFVASSAYASVHAHDMFVHARERGYALDIYEDHSSVFEGMMPDEKRSIQIPSSAASETTTTTISAYAHLYGNERIQTDITISAGRDTGTLQVRPIVFNSIRKYPSSYGDYGAGSSLCAVDLSTDVSVGSYAFQHPPLASDGVDGGVVRSPQSLDISIVPAMLPIDPHIPLTDIEMRNGIAYISADSSASDDPDIYVIDVRDPSHPEILSSIDTGPGITAISLVGQRIFAAAASTAAQLHIIRLDDLRTPFLEKKYTLPLPSATTTPPMASAILYHENTIYIGTTKWAGNELSILDVTHPLAPVLKGGFETGSKVLDIGIDQRSIYVSTAGEHQLIRLDTDDAGTIISTGFASPSGWRRQEGRVASFFEGTMRFGRTAGGFNITDDHELFSWATSSSVSDTTYRLDTVVHESLDIPGGVYGIVSDRSYVYVASRAVDRELCIFDHALSTSTVAAVALPVAPQALVCDMHTLYVLAATAPVVYQITFR